MSFNDGRLKSFKMGLTLQMMDSGDCHLQMIYRANPFDVVDARTSSLLHLFMFSASQNREFASRWSVGRKIAKI